jgi:hypothetical protein
MNLKVKVNELESNIDGVLDLIDRMENRLIALERGLEAVLRRMEASGQADDEPGWYGRPE